MTALVGVNSRHNTCVQPTLYGSFVILEVFPVLSTFYSTTDTYDIAVLTSEAQKAEST